MTDEYPIEVQYCELSNICGWKVAVNHSEDFDAIRGIENCLNCDGHDLLCPNYLNINIFDERRLN